MDQHNGLLVQVASSHLSFLSPQCHTQQSPLKVAHRTCVPRGLGQAFRVCAVDSLNLTRSVLKTEPHNQLAEKCPWPSPGTPVMDGPLSEGPGGPLGEG